ncbi:MAG: sce7726 family protein [Candidatus Omnitrophota bacterium]
MDKAELIKTKTIKWLLKGNLDFDKTRDTIATEVLFSINRRKADLLILSNKTHTLEIKSDSDDLRKLKIQLNDYYKTFDKVSVITTLKNINKIKKIITQDTGIILFNNEKFKIIKTAKLNKKLDKHSLLMFLPKIELLNLCASKNIRKLSTDEIRNKLRHQLTVNKIRAAAYLFLKKRYDKLFKFLLRDTGGKIVWDDLRGLCGKIDELYV